MEPEINTLTPENPPKSSNKVLYFVFGFLFIAIIILVVVIIIINNQPKPTNEDNNNMPVSTGLPEEELQAYYNFQDNLENIENKATEMLNKEPSNTASIHELYSNAINYYFEKNEIPNALYCFTSSIEFFNNANLYEETLRMYEDTDISKFDEITQYMLYGDAYDIATYLNNTEKINYYNQKMTELKPVWEQNIQLQEQK
ncbi:hypothetical protein IKE87_02670 [Candidatus Saccharibacteria bacterium]|nr:hypothetical protein [Candidatus Saccharibacteria bacterium]